MLRKIIAVLLRSVGKAKKHLPRVRSRYTVWIKANGQAILRNSCVRTELTKKGGHDRFPPPPPIHQRRSRSNCTTGTFTMHSSVTAAVDTAVIKVIVKCTLVQALWLCTGRTPHRGNRGIALLFHDHGTRRGWGVSVMPRPHYPRKDPVPIVQRVGWAPGTVWTGAENLAPTGIRSPDRPARSLSLYRLGYSDPRKFK